MDLENWMLLLENDNVNTQLDVGIAIFDCTGLGNYSKNVMLLAHSNGNSAIGYGTYQTVCKVQKQLNAKNLKTTIILLNGNFCLN